MRQFKAISERTFDQNLAFARGSRGFSFLSTRKYNAQQMFVIRIPHLRLRVAFVRKSPEYLAFLCTLRSPGTQQGPI